MANIKLIDAVKADYKAAEVVKNDNDEKVQKWLNVKDSKPYGTEVAHRSKYVSDMTRKLLAWQIPSIVDPLTNSKDLISCEPYTGSDRALADQEQSVLTYDIVQTKDHYSFMTDLVTIIAEQGTCFVKTGWDYREEQRMIEEPVVEVNPLTGQPELVGYQEVEKTIVTANNPTRVICDLLDVRMDPTCNGMIDKASFVIHDFETDMSTLREDGRYENLDEAMMSLQRDETYQSRDTTDESFMFQDDARKKVIVHEYWGKYDINEDGIAEPVVISWIGDTIIRQEDNPLPDKGIPFVKAVYTKVPNSIYGEPLAALTAKKQHIDSVLNRGIFDDMKLANNGQIGTKKGFADKINLKKMKQGHDFEYNTTMADVYEDKYKPISNSVFQVLGANTQDAESITGVSSFSHGTGGNALGSSAAAVNATTTSSAKREMHIIRGIAETCLIPLARKFSAYTKEFRTPEEVMQITDKQFVPSDHGSEFDIKLNIESAETRAAKAQSTGFVLQTMGPTMQPEQKNLLLARYMKLIGEPDIAKMIEEFVPKPDPVQQQSTALELAKLEAEVMNERAKGQENSVDVQLKQAKTQTELAKARSVTSDSDLKDLDFLEKEGGLPHQRQMELQSQKTRGDVIKDNNSSANKLRENLGV